MERQIRQRRNALSQVPRAVVGEAHLRQRVPPRGYEASCLAAAHAPSAAAHALRGLVGLPRLALAARIALYAASTGRLDTLQFLHAAGEIHPDDVGCYGLVRAAATNGRMDVLRWAVGENYHIA